MTLNATINYFTQFLESNGDEEIQNKWTDSIKDFKKIFNKKTKKNGPKKNKSAYNIFCGEERSKIKEEFPDLINKEYFSKLASRWKILKEKNPKKLDEYQKLAKKDKERFLKEKDEFKVEDDSTEEKEVVVSKKVKKNKKDGPKKSKSSYMLFCDEERIKIKEEFPDLNNKEYFSKLASRWKILKEKNPKKYDSYQKMAKQDKEKYLKEKENSVSIEEESD